MAVRGAPRCLARAGLVIVAPVFLACATVQPASDLPGPEPSAVGTDAGVRLEVRPAVRHPRELERPLTAIFVVIDNQSARDLRISPDAFTLVTEPGPTFRAISPDDLRRTQENPIEADIAIALQALAMNTLDAGGTAQGFLYFDELPGQGWPTLGFELRSADGGERFGLITVPLVHR